jgi:hypothetical protein
MPYALCLIHSTFRIPPSQFHFSPPLI